MVERGFIPPQLLKLYKWIADYYIASMGEVLKQALPSVVLKRFELLKKEYEAPILAKGPVPTYQQNYAIIRILNALAKKEFKVFLLYGVTGSGKTEVYLKAIAQVIRRGYRALVMVPEISMTPLLLRRFTERFGNEVISIHSALTVKERRRIWYAIKNGQFKVIIGPRSSIFIPIPNLKIIIIDEEHDHSYKEQQQIVKYNARDVAVMRGKIENIVVVLGSATPQIESYYNAGIGKYELLTLKERIDSRPLPAVEIVDLKTEERRLLSTRFEAAIKEVLKKDEQAILFLNRRGFAPSLICPNCGYVVRCPYCRLPLVYHKKTEPDKTSILACHTCDYKMQYFSLCPKCNGVTLLYQGAGTQRVEELVGKILKKDGVVKGDEYPLILRLDRDAVRKRGEVERILKDFGEGKAKILVGTQLVTKGFDFPNVTFVGIVNADTILNLPDFRSGEKTFQILTQVAGRSGRGGKPGRVLIQTFHPEQYSIIFSQLQNFPQFYAQEMKVRRELNFPPFCRLALVRLSGKNEKDVWDEARRLYENLKVIKDIRLFGPNPSFYYKIREKYRIYILIKAPLKFDHRRLRFLKNIKLKSTKLEIDIDPVEVF